MAKTDKIETEIPVFRNRTKIDQVVYDESYTSITVPTGKTIKGEWYKRYAGRNGPLVLVTGKEKDKKNDKEQSPTGGEGKE